MHLELCGRNVRLHAAARSAVARRLSAALGRLRERVARVRVVLSAADGPQGGAGKRLRAVADLPRAGRVVVGHAAANWAAAVGGAAGRLACAVRRRLALRRRGRRAGRRGKEVRHALP